MTAPSAWLAQRDPYTNEPWDRPPVAGPGVLLREAFAEPMWRRVTDPQGSGFAVDYVPAPRLRCVDCGGDTSRTIIVDIALQDIRPGPGGMIRWLVPQRAAQCPRCGERVGT